MNDAITVLGERISEECELVLSILRIVDALVIFKNLAFTPQINA